MAQTPKPAIDLNRFTVAEFDAFRALEKPTREDEHAFLGKAAGLTAEEILAMPYGEYQRLTKEYQEKMTGKDPENPN